MSQALHQQRLEPGILLPALRLPQQAADIFADAAEALFAQVGATKALSESGSEMVIEVMKMLAAFD